MWETMGDISIGSEQQANRDRFKILTTKGSSRSFPRGWLKVRATQWDGAGLFANAIMVLALFQPGMTESMLVARKRVPCWTEDKGQGETWVGLDLGSDRLLAVTHYALCSGSPEAGNDFQGWVFEGFHENSRQWLSLDPPNPSHLIHSPYGVCVFALPKTNPDHRFRRLRLRSCQPNSQGSNAIPLCAIELYGTLYTTS